MILSEIKLIPMVINIAEGLVDKREFSSYLIKINTVA
jgi:hypothetical protein